MTATLSLKSKVRVKATGQEATVTKINPTTVTVRFREDIPERRGYAFGRYRFVTLELPVADVEPVVVALNDAHSLKGLETLMRMGLEPKDVKHTPIKWTTETETVTRRHPVTGKPYETQVQVQVGIVQWPEGAKHDSRFASWGGRCELCGKSTKWLAPVHGFDKDGVCHAMVVGLDCAKKFTGTHGDETQETLIRQKRRHRLQT